MTMTLYLWVGTKLDTRNGEIEKGGSRFTHQETIRRWENRISERAAQRTNQEKTEGEKKGLETTEKEKEKILYTLHVFPHFTASSYLSSRMNIGRDITSRGPALTITMIHQIFINR